MAKLADDSGCIETHLALRFLGSGVDPDEVTRTLRMVPSRSWRRGDRYTTVDKRSLSRYITNWSYETASEIKSTNVERHALHLLEMFEQKRTEIDALAKRKDVRATIVIWWQPYDGHGNFSISSHTMARLARLAPEIEMFFV